MTHEMRISRTKRDQQVSVSNDGAAYAGRGKTRRWRDFLLGSALITGFGAFGWADEHQGLGDLSIEALMNMEVTSVSKKAQKLSDSAAAVFVITNDDIRRSGATSVPGALRMVPGVSVARIDANKWAVSARGFNGRFANKLLVLVDGRTVYSPGFSGVYWEARDVMLEDVARIEVIRGPGAALWGANAVNGVINIITRHAADTQGALVSARYGDEERAANIRVGGELGEKSYGRAYLKALGQDEFENSAGGDAGDDWTSLRGGFRFDTQASYRHTFTVSGDFYSTDIDQELILASLAPPFMTDVHDKTESVGWNMLGRWTHTVAASNELSVQVYVDRNERDEALANNEDQTFDIEFQQLIVPVEGHLLVWGVGYRYFEIEIEDGLAVSAVGSPKSENELFSFFVQDEINLIDDKLVLTLGTKVEQNDYTGTEIQPSLRLVWSPSARQRGWFAASRAVRTASRAERDLRVLTSVLPPVPPFLPPVALVVTGSDHYDAEELTAWEAGYRVTPTNDLAIDMTVFYNEYDDLRSTELGVPAFNGFILEQPLIFDNNLSGEAHGFELAAAWQSTSAWRWDLAYSYIDTDFDIRAAPDRVQNSVPARHQLSLRSMIDLTADLTLDLWVRYVDEAQAINGTAFALQQIDSYTSADLRVAWQLRPSLELALVGKNILDSAHPEYIQESFTLPTEIERSVYLQFTWRP